MHATSHPRLVGCFGLRLDAQGAAKDLDLGSMLDTVPDDMHGDKGLAKDQAGVDRLKSRQAAIESAAEEKAELMIEMGL
jgi:hypothetical protein